MNPCYRRISVFSLALAITCGGWGQPSPACRLLAQDGPQTPQDQTDPPFDLAVQLQSFDQVWETIKKTHWEPDKVGAAWDAAKSEFRPRVESATTITDVREAIGDLLNSLDQSHFGIIAREAYDEVNEEKGTGGEGTAGLEIRLLGEQLVVTRVFEDLPAALQGVQPGWAVKLIGKRTADEIIAGSRKVGEQTVLRLETAVGLVCDARSSGKPGEKIAFAFLDENDDVQLKYLELAKAPGRPGQFGNLPVFNVDFQARLLADDIGYIAFNSFLGGPQMAKEYEDALKDWQQAGKKGLIIDLRGNRGGLMLLVSAMCGWLVDRRDPLGTMTMAGGNHMNLVLNPRDPRFDKPVAVLTDECSISAAEVMAGGIKDLKVGRVFGGTTAGLVLPSTVVRLPNGDGFQYALSSWESASGDSIEGIGVEPHEKVTLTRELLSKSPDPVLQAAKKWILETDQE